MRMFSRLFLCLSVVFALCSCNSGKTEGKVEQKDSIVTTVADSTLYGVCGEGTMMHTLELVTEDGKTLSVLIDEERGSDVQGGLLNGDRMAVTCFSEGDEVVGQKVVNLTTLLGRWTSLDRNFTIKEDGSVESSVSAETRPYTQWSIVNAHLVLNTDTFDILTLGADSLTIENNDGVFVYKRQK